MAYIPHVTTPGRSTVFDYRFANLSINKSISQSSWGFTVLIDKTDFYPRAFEPLDVILQYYEQQHALFIGFAVNRDIEHARGDKNTQVDGFSYGWYLANTDVPPELRMMVKTTDANSVITSMENPSAFLAKMIWENGDGAGKRLRGMYKGRWSDVPGWGTTQPYIQFDADANTPIQNVIDDICEKTGMVFFEGFARMGASGQIWVPYCFFVHYTELDDNYAAIGLPDPVQITNLPSSIHENRMLLDPAVKVRVDAEDSKNAVLVEAYRKRDGKMFTCKIASPTIDNEMVFERCLAYPCSDLITDEMSDTQAQTAVNKRCQELYDLITVGDDTYSVSFVDRFDFRHYQNIRFTGFGDIPDEWMHITKIEHKLEKGNNITTIEVSRKRNWSMVRKLNLLMGRDWSRYAANITNRVFTQIRFPISGVLKNVSGSKGYVLVDGYNEVLEGIVWNQ